MLSVVTVPGCELFVAVAGQDGTPLMALSHPGAPYFYSVPYSCYVPGSCYVLCFYYEPYFCNTLYFYCAPCSALPACQHS